MQQSSSQNTQPPEKLMNSLLPAGIKEKLSKNGTLIVLTGDKGGVGKTSLTILLAEWLRMIGFEVRIIDADPNQGTQTCIEKCREEGYELSSAGASIRIVDTAGTSGSSLQRYILQADIILVPAQPHEADLEVVIGWFFSINPALQKRVIFIPNRLLGTKEQRDGIEQMRMAIKKAKAGELIMGLYNRPAVYPTVTSGRKENFFARKLDKNTLEEINRLFSSIFKFWHKSE